MAAGEKERNTRLEPYGLGLPLILVICVVLCLVTLAVISLMTSRQSLRNEQESLAYYEMQMKAENQAEAKIAEYDQLLKENPDQAKDQEEFTIEISVDRVLRVELARENDKYRITEWKTVIENDTEEQTMHGFTGLIE